MSTAAVGEVRRLADRAERQRGIELRQQAVLGDLDVDRRALVLLRELRELGARRVRALEELAASVQPRSRVSRSVGTRRPSSPGPIGMPTARRSAIERVEHRELAVEDIFFARRDDLLHGRDLGLRDLAALRADLR